MFETLSGTDRTTSLKASATEREFSGAVMISARIVGSRGSEDTFTARVFKSSATTGTSHKAGHAPRIVRVRLA